MDEKYLGRLPLNPRNRPGSDNFIRCSETFNPDRKVDISFGKKSFPTSSPNSNWIFPPGTNWKLSLVMLSYPSCLLTSSVLSFISRSYLVLSFFLMVAISSTTAALIFIFVPYLLVRSISTTFPFSVPPIFINGCNY